MKRRNILLVIILIIHQVSFSQEKNFNGSFLTMKEGGSVSARSIKIGVKGNDFSAALHLRENKVLLIFNDKLDHSGDYTDITGNCRGTVSGDQLAGNLTLTVIENEVGVITKNNPPARIKATIKGKEINGELIIGEEGEEEPFIIPFRAIETGNEKPELSYPAGKSPKVFDKGWIFGAEFSLLNDKGELVDLSDQVEWSGTGSFNPARGKQSRPVFRSTGANTIILSVTYEGKTFKSEFPVDVVSYLEYGHTGSLAKSGSDSHGCPGCPHIVVGPVVTGSTLVFAGHFPAARVGDLGVHSACCENNSFVITSGDPEVLIEGKPAAKPGLSATRHCGGDGILIKDASATDDGMLMAGYSLSNPDASMGEIEEYLKKIKSMHAGDVFTTGQKGILAFPGNNETSITLFPNSVLKIIEQTKEKIRLMLVKGHLLVNGNTNKDKKVLVDLKDLAISPAGTKFLVYTDSTGDVTVNVYEGKLSIRQFSTNTVTETDSGYVFRYSGNRVSVITLGPGNEFQQLRELMTGVDNRSVTVSYERSMAPEGINEKTGIEKSSFIQKNWIYIAGAAVLFIVLLILIFKQKRKSRE